MQDATDRSLDVAEPEDSDLSFIRTEDVICLSCSSGDSMRQGYLAAKGFGSPHCHLVPEPQNKEPCELWRCMFTLEDAMSVHAMYTYGMSGAKEKRSGSRKILMYGHAVLLRHVPAKCFLSCLTSSPNNDKMAYDVGFTRSQAGELSEAHWFTIHPSTSQRSVGEKVRAGDDVFLVSVANERYLSAENAFFQITDNDPFAEKLPSVQASFHQCVWSLNIVSSGSAKEAAAGYVNGGDIVRLMLRYKNKGCLTVAARDCDINVKLSVPEKVDICYEPLGDASHLRSLWRVELFQMRFGGGFTSWGQPFRLKHIVSGKYLAVRPYLETHGNVRSEAGGGMRGSIDERRRGSDAMEYRQRSAVCLLEASQADYDLTAFCFSKATIQLSSLKEVWSHPLIEGMGTPEVCFGDSEVYLTHIKTGRVVGCPVAERRMHSGSMVQGAIVGSEIHRMFAFTVTRAPEEEGSAGGIIQRTHGIMRDYVHKMNNNRVVTSETEDELLTSLTALLSYFQQPSEDCRSHEDRQRELVVLRERQGLFRKQGALQFTLSVIMDTSRHASPATGEVKRLLYQLLAAMIRGNHDNCRAFATQRWLGVFMKQLANPTHSHYVLDIIQCLLTDSPEVLHIITAGDISSIVQLLHTNGRDAKVMQLLSTLCVSKGVAMRDKQHLIFKHLLACRDLLLHTTLRDRVHSVHPNVYIGSKDNSALSPRWYYEVKLTQLIPEASINTPHLRVGWAHLYSFQPHPSSSGQDISQGGVGDDVFSIGFDGAHIWVGGHSLTAPTPKKRLMHQNEIEDETMKVKAMPLNVDDVIGCCLDVERGVVWFTRNGVRVGGEVIFKHCRDLLTPAISFSAGISALVCLGGHHGPLSHALPTDHAPLIDAVDLTSEVKLLPFRCLGVSNDLVVRGPMILADYEAFVPAPIVTTEVTLPDPLLRSGLKDRLAENIHEVWAKNKIEAGYSFAEVRNDQLKHNPNLRPFNDLSEGDRHYDYDMALGTLSTLIALGYQISTRDSDIRELPYMELSADKYQMSNGYIPQPLNLEGVTVPKCLCGLVEKLAENAHNVWAAGRISEGWTFGAATNKDRKKNSLLVPYSKLDVVTRKSNEDTALESIRTIIALGCTIAPSTDSIFSDIQQLTRQFSDSQARTRTFRGQTCYTLTSGKWYYEVKLLTGGMMRVGWATPSFMADTPLGTDTHSYGFDGFLGCKWHNGSVSFGRRWEAGDVVGCLLDIDDKTMSFTLNGDFLQDAHSDSTLAFVGVVSSSGFVPAITLSAGEEAQFNFGRSEEALYYDYSTGGFQPVCTPSALSYNLPLWYSAHGGYENIDHTHPTLSAKTHPLSLDQPDSIISVTLKDWDFTTPPKQECLRLCMGVASKHTNPTDVDEVKEVCYSAVVPAGQDPEYVFIGWTTPEFRYVEEQFKLFRESPTDKVLYGQQIDLIGQSEGGVAHYSTAFIVCLSELLSEPIQLLPYPLTVVCVLDLTVKELLFSVETPQGANLSTTKRVIPMPHSSKLFPTVVITPTTSHVIDFDFNPRPDTAPLSLHLFGPFRQTAGIEADPTLFPLCPPRFKVQSYMESRWVRQMLYKSGYSVGVASSGQLHFTSDHKRSFSVLLQLPQEEEVVDILEISEHHSLMEFHIRTLEAYCAVCSHSNLELAQQVSECLESVAMLRYMSVADEAMRYNLTFAYFQLFFALHLKHEVQTRLAMRGEFVIPLSDCTQSVPLFPLGTVQPQKQVFSLSHAPLPGLGVGATDHLCHNVSSSFSRLPYAQGEWLTGRGLDLVELKNHVFQNLQTLLSTRSYCVKLRPASLSQIFVPLITALDHLLVVGELSEEEDIQRLLKMLHPQLFSSSSEHMDIRTGLLSDDVACEEPIKAALCELLHHLCDCQVQHRVESVVTFAHSFVNQLHEEQKERHAKYFHSKPREFRCPPEMQLQMMLTRRLNPTLQDRLNTFHQQLQKHCGGSEVKGQSPETLTVSQKLEQIVKLINSPDEPSFHDNKRGGTITSLRELITTTMVEWAESEIHNSDLIGQIFSLLHRQFNEMCEIAEALKKTYVIDLTGKQVRIELGQFISALGSLRLLRSVGMSKNEELLMKNSFNVIQSSKLFYCHPHLLRQLGVHTTVLGLIRSYLGIRGGSEKRHRSVHRKLGALRNVPPPVEDCCRFLCNFARVSQENQRVLFSHIGYLLQHMEKYPDLMFSSGSTPLDVATATIRDNQELALALEEGQLESVVQLLVAITTNDRSSQELLYPASGGGGLGMVHSASFSVSYEWNPRVGGKCLEFLQCAVWVDDEQIQENAYCVVRLLIRHSECMGPALAGDALGLYAVYKEAIENHLESEPPSHVDTKCELGGVNESFSSSRSSLFSRQSTMSTILNNSLSTRTILTYYTSLVRLLASCAPHVTAHIPSGHTHNKGGNQRTQNILRNLIKIEDIVNILALAYTTEEEQGVSPAHKMAVVWFLERVYKISDPEVLLELLSRGFLPDIKLALQTASMRDRSSQFCVALNRYVCSSVLPLLSGCGQLFKALLPQLHVIDGFLSCTLRLYTSVQLSAGQLDNIATFLITFSRELHPKALQRYIPKIIANLSRMDLTSAVHCKFLTAHYTHYARYYQSGALDKSFLGHADEEEKTAAALVVHRLIDTLADKLPEDPALLRCAVGCLKAASCALSPDCLIPLTQHLQTVYPSSVQTYEPRPLDTSKVNFTTEHAQLSAAYASYLHDCWVYEHQCEGWSFGEEEDSVRHKHPHLRPFTTLSQELQSKSTERVAGVMKGLLSRGYSLSKQFTLDSLTIPYKPKKVCIRRPRKSVISRQSPWVESPYEPEVWDLSKVELRLDLRSVAETLAEDMHDRWAIQQKQTECHALLQPYVLLEEECKEELRGFVFDLLRFLRAMGYEANRSYRNLCTSYKTSSSKDKFGVQLFDKFLSLLKDSTHQSSSPTHSFHLQVLFPILTQYLSQHTSYFMPTIGGHRGHSFASKAEKTKILKMFCRVIEYTQQHLPQLLQPMTTPPTVLERPSPESGAKSDSDINWITTNCILSLLTSLVKALDISGVQADGEGLSTECPEAISFFRKAVSAIHLTAKNIANLNKLDAQLHFYCLHLLIPALNELFAHLGRHGNGGLLIKGGVQTHCRYIFQNLVEMAMSSGPVYVGSSPLITIGRCMGSFSRAYPDPFLEDGSFGFSLLSLLQQLHQATEEGVTCGNVLFVVDIINPVLTSYLSRWCEDKGQSNSNSVTIAMVNEVVGAILQLLMGHFAMPRVTWFPRLLDGALLLSNKCSVDLLGQLVEITVSVRERVIALWGEEQYLSATWNQQLSNDDDQTDHTQSITQEYRVLCRDLGVVLSVLAVFLHTHSTILHPHASTPSHPHSTPSHLYNPDTTEAIRDLFISLADIFHCWSSSQILKRELQTVTFTLMEESNQFKICRQFVQSARGRGQGSCTKKPPNLLLACLELLLPLSDQELCPEDRVIVGVIKKKLGKKKVVVEDLKKEIVQELEARANKSQPLARKLVRTLSQQLLLTPLFRSTEEKALNILSIAEVRFKLEQVERGHLAKTRWKQLFSQRKRKAIVKCFLAVPYFNVKKHRAINMFLEQYRVSWLSSDQTTHHQLTEELLDRQDYLRSQESQDQSHDKEVVTRDTQIDPLSQLFTMFKRAAMANQDIMTSLYIAYAECLSKSIVSQHEEDDTEGVDIATEAFELYSQHKAELIAKQGQLADRGAPHMVLIILTVSHGEPTSLVHATLKLGAALLKEGNKRVQEEMLMKLQGMDVGFLSSIATLISTCGVLDWNAYQRFNKASGPSGPSGSSTSSECVCKVLPRSSLTVSLFRFLQLLCEGHNFAFQNYLRTQAGNTTTVNIVTCTVDYLMRLQESISDFYWHYSDYPAIDLQGRENFLKAFKVAKQVVRTLTEYIQGPCLRNQEALARSRLWDAVAGFLHVFSVLQRKLYRETSQVELLRELLSLQEEVFILLLSLLEGSTMSSGIGRLMLDMLLEAEMLIIDIAQFFLIFVKLKDAITSKAFREYDLNKDGFISYDEFEKAMEAQQKYSKEEIAYLMDCADLNKDGFLDYMEFTERFHQPAKNIGFHLCVLLVHLSDLLPSESRLTALKQVSQLKELITHFNRNMGCIEILGKSGRVERVYFEVTHSQRRQWKTTQIQESRVNFLHSIELSSQKNKLKGFVSFCEDAIFEMDQAEKITGNEQQVMENRASLHRRTHNTMIQSRAFLSRVRARMDTFRQNHSQLVRLMLTLWASLLWVWLILKKVVGKTWNMAKSYYKVIREKLRPRQVTPTVTIQSSSPKHRPSKLKLPSGIKDQITDQKTTTVHKTPPTLRGIERHSSLINGAELASERSKFTRGISYEPRRGSLISPRLYNPHNLTLTYDRSRMKQPSLSMDISPAEVLHRDRTDSYIPGISIAPHSWPAKLARNYYRLNSAKYTLAFLINVILLTFKVASFDTSYSHKAMYENGTVYELQDPFLAPLLLKTLALGHFVVSLVLIVSYLYLKVPLIIFKREKEIARKLEHKQLWVSHDPASLQDWWDGLVVSSHSFPRNYFDKQVKRRVVESQGPGKAKARADKLGMLTKSKFEKRSKLERVLELCRSIVDVKYNLWALGVTVSDMMMLYQLFYCALSFVGLNFSYFFFSYHLLDLVMSFKLLRTVLNSVLNNYRQLAMTLLMTGVVIYIYTVIAFNFFRKFYRQTSPEIQACDSMFRCFIYHIDQGLRSGGGIADVLEPASGDPNEFTRLFFDITFFFVVIVILLAIIQGLIIDSFGELRDREETLSQEMASKCFICGQTKSKFDRVPHGFENHVYREHNMAHYLFFLLYLIKKKESEFSGQESYVWEMYLRRDWNFFPVGDSFRAQLDALPTRGTTPLSGQRGKVEEGSKLLSRQSSPVINKKAQTRTK